MYNYLFFNQDSLVSSGKDNLAVPEDKRRVKGNKQLNAK